jgi:hypothetical protein
LTDDDDFDLQDYKIGKQFELVLTKVSEKFENMEKTKTSEVKFN